MLSFIRKNRYKNSKLLYYFKSIIHYCTPKSFLVKKLPKLLAKLELEDNDYILSRVNYYNKMVDNKPIDDASSVLLYDFVLKNYQSAYFFDTYEYTRYFSEQFRISPLFGDITHVPIVPSITKSRPIKGDNSNSVLLNLDKARHFTFVKDNKNFTDKLNILIGRANVKQPHRIRFMEMYFNHPMCNLGQINKSNAHPEWHTRLISIDEHLDYKFILCLEGYDVATNLKWVMSSNSLAVMPKPKYETWYMEGTLIPDYHYVCIKDDYSDLEARLNYYINNPDEAQFIIDNAHKHVAQFQNQLREDLISLCVLKKYFEKTGQIIY